MKLLKAFNKLAALACLLQIQSFAKLLKTFVVPCLVIKHRWVDGEVWLEKRKNKKASERERERERKKNKRRRSWSAFEKDILIPRCRSPRMNQGLT